jgi:hypothetical protein
MANLLPPGTHILSGAESQRLSTFCSNETFSAADPDDYASLPQNRPLSAIKADFQSRQLSDIAYGPTKIPLYNFILQLTILVPHSRAFYVSIIR